jgi:hypothetical protein
VTSFHRTRSSSLPQLRGVLSTSNRRPHALSTILGRPWWEGVAAIVGILALGVGVVQCTGDSKPSQPTKVSGNGLQTGNCNAQGNGNDACNTIVYPPAPAVIGSVGIQSVGSSLFYFDGKPSQLPIPPDYPPFRVLSHCDDWEDWISRTPGIFSIDPILLISMTSGQGEQVVVKSAKATIFSKKEISGRDFAIIQCQYGGDAEAGSEILIDTLTNETKLKDIDSPTSGFMKMPPAALVLNGANYESVLLSVNSSAGFLYTGQVTITAEVNGKESKIEFGSRDRPFKWSGDDVESSLSRVDNTRYDWNPLWRQWIANLDPNDVQPVR